MPEYLAPGVYVVEIDARPEPIPGIPTRVDDDELRAVSMMIRERLARFNPRWTASNDSDPGVTLLELLAWLSEVLIYRSGPSTERSSLHAARLAAGALALLARPKPSPSAVLKLRPVVCGWRSRLIRLFAQ